MSLRSILLSSPFGPPPASRSAVTGQKRSASARVAANSDSAPPPLPAPRRSSSRRRSKRSVTSRSSGAEMPAGAGFSLPARTFRGLYGPRLSMQRAHVVPRLRKAELAHRDEQEGIQREPRGGRGHGAEDQRCAAERERGCGADEQ